MDLTTLARVKAVLEQGGVSADALDGLITSLIPGVSARMEQLLGRHVEAAERTEDFNADPRDHGLVLYGFPVTAVASVSYDESRTFGASTVVDSGLYHVDLARGVLRWDGFRLGAGPGVIRIVYTGGMAANTAAFITAFPDLALACDLQVSYLVQRRSAPGGTATVAGAGSRSYVDAYNLLPDVKDAVLAHRRRVF